MKNRKSQIGFNQILTKYNGNVYEACRAVQVAAHRLYCKYKEVLLESEAITWVLTGETPECIKRYYRNLNMQKVRDLDRIANEYLSYVDDKNIRDSVRESLEITNRFHHLLYVYEDVDDSKKARIRILTRMIWYDYLNSR